MRGEAWLILAIATCVTSSIAYRWGRRRGCRARIERLPWHVELGTARDLVEVHDRDYGESYVNGNKDLIVQLESGRRVLQIGKVSVQSDRWGDEFQGLVRKAEDRAMDLNAHLEELSR